MAGGEGVSQVRVSAAQGKRNPAPPPRRASSSRSAPSAHTLLQRGRQICQEIFMEIHVIKESQSQR